VSEIIVDVIKNSQDFAALEEEWDDFSEDTASWIKSAADSYCTLQATRSREKEMRS
jgi:hypothetical protein